MEQFLTVDQVAEQLQVHGETVRRWLRAGRMRGVRIGGTGAGWRIPASEIARLMRAEPAGGNANGRASEVESDTPA